MARSNKIEIELRVTTEPELKHGAAGGAFCKFGTSLSMGKDKRTDQWKPSGWLDVTCFGGRAERVAESVRKGDSVTVIGRLSYEEWTAKDGTVRKSWGIMADEVNLPEVEGQQHVQTTAQTPVGGGYSASDDDIPFARYEGCDG